MSIRIVSIFVILFCFAFAYYFYKSLKSGYNVHALLGFVYGLLMGIIIIFILLADLFPGY